MDETDRLRRPDESMLDRWFTKRLGQVVGPTGERIHFVHRRHWLVLVAPGALLTVGCVVVLLAQEPRLWLALSAGGWVLLERWRRRWGQLRTALVAALWLVPLWLTLGLASELFRALALLALLVALLVTITRWCCEALVLTDTSLWKISGVLTTASPKAPLTQILFQDVRQSMVEQALRCGTLSFDTAGASDAPLAHFGPIDDPFVVSAEIHQQRLRSSPAGRAVPPPPP